MDSFNDFVNDCIEESLELGVPKATVLDLFGKAKKLREEMKRSKKETRTVLDMSMEHAYLCDEPNGSDNKVKVTWMVYLVPAPCNEWRIMRHETAALDHPLESDGVSLTEERWLSFPADLHAKFL